jgi:hypothetical protein
MLEPADAEVDEGRVQRGCREAEFVDHGGERGRGVVGEAGRSEK